MSADAREAEGLTDYQLRERIIEIAARIDANDGRLSADSSADLDLAQEMFDAALEEYVRRGHERDGLRTVPRYLWRCDD